MSRPSKADDAASDEPAPIQGGLRRGAKTVADSARLVERLRRRKPDWTIAEAEVEAFPFPVAKKLPAWRPPGRRPRRLTVTLDAPLAVPPRWDWRDHAVIAPPRDQGQCNCCTAFALAAIMTDLGSIAAGQAMPPLSPGHLHWCIGGCDCATALDGGAAVAALGQTAVAQLSQGDYPFDPRRCPTTPGVARLAGADPIYSEDEALQALRVGPIYAVMDLYDDFWSHYGGGIYHHLAGAYLNNHSIEIIGYDNGQNCWIVKNSRGPGWGDRGYALIRRGECRILTRGGHGALRVRLR